MKNFNRRWIPIENWHSFTLSLLLVSRYVLAQLLVISTPLMVCLVLTVIDRANLPSPRPRNQKKSHRRWRPRLNCSLCCHCEKSYSPLTLLTLYTLCTNDVLQILPKWYTYLPFEHFGTIILFMLDSF